MEMNVDNKTKCDAQKRRIMAKKKADKRRKKNLPEEEMDIFRFDGCVHLLQLYLLVS